MSQNSTHVPAHCHRCPNPISTPSASSNNKAVLEDIVKAIDAVARPNGPPLSTATAATVVPPAAAVAAPAAASAAAALTPPAPPPATNVTAGWSTRSSGDHGARGTAVSEANGGARGSSRSPLVSDSGAVGAAGDGGAVKGSDGRPSSRGGGGSAPALGTRNDVLAAAAEVNGVGGDAGGASSRIAQGDEAPSAAEPVAAAAESQGKGTSGTKENDLVVEPVEAAERGAPPASMAEVGLKRGNCFLIDGRALSFTRTRVCYDQTFHIVKQTLLSATATSGRTSFHAFQSCPT